MNENLFGQLHGAGKVASTGSATIFGVEIALVTNVQDPQKLGRVKVCFPRMSGMPESDWARVVQPAAGPGRGFYWLPEVNDEVLVAFEMGQPNRPYVLRGLWNAKDKPMKDAYADDNTTRMIQTKSGHQIALYDKDGEEKITICDGSGKRVLACPARPPPKPRSNGRCSGSGTTGWTSMPNPSRSRTGSGERSARRSCRHAAARGTRSQSRRWEAVRPPAPAA